MTTHKFSMERLYDVLRHPVITEKATLESNHNQVTFRVPLDATKAEIKAAVETLFKARVKAVNTLIRKGKTKRFRGTIGQRSDVENAVVTLEPGQTVDFTSGV